jgi:hypothetical protein
MIEIIAISSVLLAILVGIGFIVKNCVTGQLSNED